MSCYDQREKVTKVVENVILMENLDMELALSTADPHKVLEKVKKEEKVGIYFLDIDLKSDINGLLLAKEIRNYDPRGFVVFVTTHSEMSYMTFIYKLEAMDFIIKDDAENISRRIYECLLNANQKYLSANNFTQPHFTIKIGDKILSADYDEIMFFETSANVHKVILHCENRVLEFYGKIKDIEKSLDERFYRCHRSFIVNKDNIKEINVQDRIIYMKNGEECLGSLRLMKGIK